LVGDRLKEYELLFIVSPRVPADDVPAAIDRVTALVTSGGGEVLSTDNWGRRRLAYPIKHYFEGTYALLTLRMPPAAAAPLEASLILSEEVIRHLLTEGIIPPASRDRGPAAFEDRDRAPAPVEPAVAAAAVAVAEAPTAVAEAPVAVADESPAEPVADEPERADAPQPDAAETVIPQAETPQIEGQQPETPQMESQQPEGPQPGASADSEAAATEPAPAATE